MFLQPMPIIYPHVNGRHRSTATGNVGITAMRYTKEMSPRSQFIAVFSADKG